MEPAMSSQPSLHEEFADLRERVEAHEKIVATRFEAESRTNTGRHLEVMAAINTMGTRQELATQRVEGALSNSTRRLDELELAKRAGEAAKLTALEAAVQKNSERRDESVTHWSRYLIGFALAGALAVMGWLAARAFPGATSTTTISETRR